MDWISYTGTWQVIKMKNSEAKMRFSLQKKQDLLSIDI